MKRQFAVTIAVLILTACAQSNGSDSVVEFFSTHKIGSAADFGIFHDKHELVVAVFAFADDLRVCEKLADALNKDEPGAFNCAPLNH